MRCPTDLPSGVAWVTRKDVPKNEIRRAVEPDDEYVIDRFMSHAKAEDESEWLIRVRWAGFSSSDDTWEPAREPLAELVRRYERRKKLSAGVLTQPGPPVIEQRPRFGAQALTAQMKSRYVGSVMGNPKDRRHS